MINLAISSDMEDRLKFLAEVFNGVDGWINIREIHQGQVKNHFFDYDGLKEYTPPNDREVYYGVYTRREKGNGTAANCVTTGALWADFDHKSCDEVKDSIKNAGLPKPSCMVSSGHGFHTYWFLKQRAGEEAVPVLKSIAEITGADTKTAEQARVMRLPNTTNVKEKPVKCEIISLERVRYDLNEFPKKQPVKNLPGESEPFTKSPTGLTVFIHSNWACIRSMAQGVKEGQRNFALGRLVKYLQIQGFDREASYHIIQKWNRNNSPPEDNEKLTRDFRAYWKGNYKLLGCRLDNSELRMVLADHCDKTLCKISGCICFKLDNTTRFNNRLFGNYRNLTGNDLIVYGILLRHKEGLTTKQLLSKLKSSSTGKPCITDKVFYQCGERLEIAGLLSVYHSPKKIGNFYKITPEVTYGTGFTLVTNGAINGAIDGRVTPAEFKLYVLLLKYAFCKGSCYPSIDTLGQNLRISKNAVSQQLKRSESAAYIKRNRSSRNGGQKLVFSLLV